MRRRHLALAGDEVVAGWSIASGVQAVSVFGARVLQVGWFPVDSLSCEIISSGIITSGAQQDRRDYQKQDRWETLRCRDGA